MRGCIYFLNQECSFLYKNNIYFYAKGGLYALYFDSEGCSIVDGFCGLDDVMFPPTKSCVMNAAGTLPNDAGILKEALPKNGVLLNILNPPRWRLLLLLDFLAVLDLLFLRDLPPESLAFVMTAGLLGSVL